ncbi:unnamed protein product [Rotaria socialis]|uniref:Uncharacterized protein n=1 Tax=Rotaria socialis TaxID=392032 RepID=A0A818KFB6_9BILA|nr:unnamed protein product [Rotaria socialis]CAF3559243.1 unnamed protein product [Rotaria socialis]CAF4221866.1 unnamed protein product [Rotaria socialis]CAF4585015.1 unnamed protein product [Rotaria socialis]
MTSSSTIRKSTTLKDQVEHNNDYNKKVLEDNHIYIPHRYYQPLAKSGLMEQFIHIILNVNEKLFNSKQEINLPVSILSTPPTPTYTERILVNEDF